MPVRIEALAMSPWATPVARLAGVPVVVAVRYFAAIAVTGVVGEAGGTNSGVAEWFLECLGDSLGLVCLDRVAEPVPAGDSLEQQVPLCGVAVLQIDGLGAFLPGGPLAGQVSGSDEFVPGGGSVAHGARQLNCHASHHVKDPSPAILAGFRVYGRRGAHAHRNRNPASTRVARRRLGPTIAPACAAGLRPRPQP